MGTPVVNRLAIEELEGTWYFPEIGKQSEPRIPRASAKVPSKAPYRDPDLIAGGTWEAFEREMKRTGYFKTGLTQDRSGALDRSSHGSETKHFAELSSAAERAIGDGVGVKSSFTESIVEDAALAWLDGFGVPSTSRARRRAG